MVRPALVVADPELMASPPLTRLAASAMNALAHAMEALYTPLRSPLCDLAALRAAGLLAEGVTQEPAEREQLALGAVLAGWASGSAGIAFHHAVCQRRPEAAGSAGCAGFGIVRTAGTPHAETNAVMLPHSARLMAGRAPGPMSDQAAALGDDCGDPRRPRRTWRGSPPGAATRGWRRSASTGSSWPAWPRPPSHTREWR
jgi:maleylacetate reductase